MALNLVTSFQEIATHTRLLQDLREATKNKLFYEQADNFFTIQPGIKGGQQVVSLDPLEYVTKKETGCGTVGDAFSIGGITQVWEPMLAKVNIKMCYTEFQEAFTRWGLANGYDIHDLSKADFFNFIQDLVRDAMIADFIRLALFGDADIAAQSILGVAGKSVYYDVIKRGLIPTLQYFKTEAELADNFIALAKNTELTRALQFTMDADYGLNLFEDLTDNQYFDSDQILTSQSLYKNYKNFLRRGAGNIPLESSKEQIQSGMESLKFDGNLLTPIKFHDKKRLEDFTFDVGNGLVTHLPHFALNTSKSNLVIGVDDVNALTDLRLEYVGGEDEHFYIKGNYQMDFKIPNPRALRAAI